MKCLCRSTLFLFAAASLALPAGMPIGVATAIGAYTVNDAVAQGATAISDGANLTTTLTPTQVMLANGVDVTLATRTRGQLYTDHVVLSDGAVKVNHFDPDFSVSVRSLTIQSDSPQADAIVRANGNTVEVASLGGSVRVTDGVRMVRVYSGTKMAFAKANAGAGQTQTGASTPVPPNEADTHALEWSIVVIAAAAAIIGGVAAYQGKNPF